MGDRTGRGQNLKQLTVKYPCLLKIQDRAVLPESSRCSRCRLEDNFCFVLYNTLHAIAVCTFFFSVVVFCLYHIDDACKTFNFHFQLHIVSRRKKRNSGRGIDILKKKKIHLKFIMHSEICMKITGFGFCTGVTVYSKNHRFRRV